MTEKTIGVLDYCIANGRASSAGPSYICTSGVSSLSSEDLIPVPSLAEHVREMWILDLWCLGGEDLLSIIVQRGSFVISKASFHGTK
jgi:hypothetical protein